jgi:hypothetical protein
MSNSRRSLTFWDATFLKLRIVLKTELPDDVLPTPAEFGAQ